MTRKREFFVSDNMKELAERAAAKTQSIASNFPPDQPRDPARVAAFHKAKGELADLFRALNVAFEDANPGVVVDPKLKVGFLEQLIGQHTLKGVLWAPEVAPSGSGRSRG